MSRRLILFPTIGFGVAFIAAATLQPVIGSFNRAFQFEGDAGIAAAFQERTSTPVRGVYPITVTPTLPPLQVALAGAAAGAGSAVAIETAATSTATKTPPATNTSRPSPASTRAAASATSTKTPAASATATKTSTATATKTSTATATVTSTATATATPDPCGPVRDANLTFHPDTQTLRGSNRVSGQLTLTNTGLSGRARDLVLRITAPSGPRYLTGLIVEGQAPAQDGLAPSIDVRLGDLGPGQEVGIEFEATVLWPSASTLTTAVAPSVELRFEVVSDACRPLGAPTPSATVRILAALTPVAVKPASATAVEADVDSLP